jgi:alpha-D-ribose 1-methylphosphonate 5-triphosphate synthase subunit PhnI
MKAVTCARPYGTGVPFFMHRTGRLLLKLCVETNGFPVPYRRMFDKDCAMAEKFDKWVE